MRRRQRRATQSVRPLVPRVLRSSSARAARIARVCDPERQFHADSGDECLAVIGLRLPYSGPKGQVGNRLRRSGLNRRFRDPDLVRPARPSGERVALAQQTGFRNRLRQFARSPRTDSKAGTLSPYWAHNRFGSPRAGFWSDPRSAWQGRVPRGPPSTGESLPAVTRWTPSDGCSPLLPRLPTQGRFLLRGQHVNKALRRLLDHIQAARPDPTPPAASFRRTPSRRRAARLPP